MKLRALILLLGFCLTASYMLGQRAATADPEIAALLSLSNQARAAAGLHPLRWDAGLALAAQLHCQRMADEGPIAHRYAGEADLANRATSAGAHFKLIEENIAAAADASAIHQAWMHSPSHRANLLSPQIDRVGFGLVRVRGIEYAVADYSAEAPDLTQTEAEAAVAAMLKAHGVTVLPDVRDARAACALDHGFPAQIAHGTPSFIMRWQDSSLASLPRPLLSKIEHGGQHQAIVGSCPAQDVEGAFTVYRIAVLLY